MPPVQAGGMYDVRVGDGHDHPTRRPDVGELTHDELGAAQLREALVHDDDIHLRSAAVGEIQ